MCIQFRFYSFELLKKLRPYLIFVVFIFTVLISIADNGIPKDLNKNSLRFTENQGQIVDQNGSNRKDVLFAGETSGFSFFLRNNGISYQTSKVVSWKPKEEILKNSPINPKDSLPNQISIYRLDVQWVGTNSNFSIVKENELGYYQNFYTSSCPDGALNVKSYSSITYENIYEGIDIKWYQNNGELEYDYIVERGRDYKKIIWEI